MKKNTPLSQVPQEAWLKKSMIFVSQFTRSIDGDDFPEPILEYQFHPTREWPFDLAWPQFKIGVEFHGATFVGGRHTRGTGFMGDRQKMNAAQLLGWRVFEFTPAMIASGEARRTLVWAVLGEEALVKRLNAEGYDIPTGETGGAGSARAGSAPGASTQPVRRRRGRAGRFQISPSMTRP